jgi:hypothetical protein
MTYLDWAQGFNHSSNFTNDVPKYIAQYGCVSPSSFIGMRPVLPFGFRKLVP